MDKIRVCVAGATGWIGRSLIPIIHNASDMSLVGAVSRSSSGKDIGTLLNVRGLSVWIKSNVKDALDTPADVLVDFTSPDSVKSNVLTAIRRGVSAVVGTSGLSDEEIMKKLTEKLQRRKLE